MDEDTRESIPLTDDAIHAHASEKQTLGVYPLSRLVIDGEHAPTDNAGRPNMLRATRTPALVRVPYQNPETIQAAQENAPNGVIVPRLHTVRPAGYSL